METRRLRAFMEIVDSGSITRAARNLRVAQPALTQQVNELERQFKAQLLTRSHRGVSATPAGLRLYRHAQLISQQLNNALRDVPAELAGVIRLGVVASVEQVILSTLLNEVKNYNPSICISTSDGSSQQIAENVCNRSLDIGLVFLDAPVEGTVSTPLLSERLCLVSKMSHTPIFENENNKRLTYDQLESFPLLLPSTGNIHRKFVDSFYAARGLTPNVVAEINSMTGLISAMQSGLGMAILPAWTRALVDDDVLFEDIPNFERTLSLCVAEGSQFPLTQTVADLIRKVIVKLVEEKAWQGARLLAPNAVADPAVPEPGLKDEDHSARPRRFG